MTTVWAGVLVNLNIVAPGWRTLHTHDLDTNDVNFKCKCLVYGSLYECANYQALMPSDAELVRVFRFIFMQFKLHHTPSESA